MKPRTYPLQRLGMSLHTRYCVPYISVEPKWLLVFVGSSHILTELSSVNFMLVGTSLTGPSFIVTVDVPLNEWNYLQQYVYHSF